MATMEVKVFVDGVARVVCGVTEETTCQDVVIALAQALGQPGRYTLRETFKDFERCMSPGERLLETLEKYGEQAKEVQLKLHHTGPLVWDDMSRTKRGSGTLSLHRQSLPPMSCTTQEAGQQKEDLKKPKRKSLTLMEEAWEWLESLGKESKRPKKGQEAGFVDLYGATSAAREDEKHRLRETIVCQLSCLQDLQLQIASVDTHISELEGKQSARRASQEAQRRFAEEEMEQIRFWEKELKAEEGYEKDLEGQFLEMRAKALECKSRLEEYKRKMQ
uniref:Ras association domain family member 11 n=1 Tax=Tetraodon nigroviridis TaxID=99883 RepID=H3CZX3_TETNG